MNAFFLHPQNRAKGILFIFLVTNFLLVSCSEQTSENSTQTSSSTYTSTSQTGETLVASDGVTVKVIKVTPNCIGCGKCTHIDAAHFSMNNTTHKAEPIQASGNESNLERAIDHCPVSAISVT